jgi:hypothetical protein
MHVAIGKRNRITNAAVALLGLAMLPAALHCGQALAADTDHGPAALVMETTGTTKPVLTIHREVAAGTDIAIAPGAHLSLLHYSTCSIVAFKGGTVHVTEQGLEAQEANIESSKPGPCPHVHKIALAGPGPLGGGIVSRAIGQDPHPDVEVAADGMVVIKGDQAPKAVSVDVYDWKRILVAGGIAVENQSFQLNGTLPPRRPYYLSIHFAGRAEPTEVPIAISPANSKGLLILRFE